MRSTHRCIVCGRPITWTFAICDTCEKEYGTRAPQWPAWLRFLWADYVKQRRHTADQMAHEIVVDSETLDAIQASDTGKKLLIPAEDFE